jgi:hypothetical protein
MSKTISQALKDDTEATNQEQQEMLASWEGGAKVSLEQLCIAYTMTAQDIENMKHHLPDYDADGQQYLTATLERTNETLSRLTALLAKTASVGVN